MVNRYQIVSGLMALVAVFLVFVASKYLKVELPNVGRQQSNLSFELDKDWDNDGLTNREESYWNTDPNNPDTDSDGYLDGEEVASGHDPLIPGPDDLLPTNNNLTMKMSQLTLAGLYEGSLNPDNPDILSSLDILALTIIDDAKQDFTVNTSEISLNLVDSDKTRRETYIREFSKIFEGFLKTYVNQMRTIEKNLETLGNKGFEEDLAKTFQQNAAKYRGIFNELVNVPVPKNWESNHVDILKLIGSLAEANNAIASGENDPVKALIGFNHIILLWDAMLDISESYAIKARENGLKLDITIK